MVSESDRGQAFTVEGFIASIVLMSAVVFSLQATVLTPTTGGEVSAEARTQLESEARDLVLAVGERQTQNFRGALLDWDSTERQFDGAVDGTVGYGADGPPPDTFDRAFEDTFRERGYTYNLQFRYRGGNTSNLTDGGGSLAFVDRGPPAPDAVTVGYTFALYDNETLDQTVNSDGRELWEYDQNATNAQDGYFPIPDAAPNSPLYNVVEVRLTVW